MITLINSRQMKWRGVIQEVRMVMACAPLHNFHVVKAKTSPPEVFYLRADPIHYTENVGFLSAFLDAQWIAWELSMH